MKDHLKLYRETLRQSLLELAEYPSEVRVCIENDRLSDMAVEVLEELLPMGKLFLTWDIPKSHTDMGKPIARVENFLLKHIEKIQECHLHDQKPGKPSHDVLGIGKIDFAHYLRLLVPRDIHFTLEIRPREDVLRSMKKLKDMFHEIGWEISTHN